MAPIRKGDGTTIAPTDYQQVRKGDGTVLFDAIPDSVNLQYFATTYQSGDAIWTDDVGDNDMTLSGGETESTLSDGADAIAFDGVDDGGDIPSFAAIENEPSFTVEAAVQFTSTDILDLIEAQGTADSTSGGTFQLFFNVDETFSQDAGQVFFDYNDGSDRHRLATDGLTLNDGVRHNITIKANDVTQNNVDIIVDGSVISTVTEDAGSPTTISSFEQIEFASNNRTGRTFVGDVGALRWHGDQAVDQTIGNY